MCSTVVIAKIDPKQGLGHGQNESGAPLAQIDAPEGGTYEHRTLWCHLLGDPVGSIFGTFPYFFRRWFFDASLKRCRPQFHAQTGARSGQKGHQNGAEKDPKQIAANV